MDTLDSSPKLRIGFGAGFGIDDNATALKRRLSAVLDKFGK